MKKNYTKRLWPFLLCVLFFIQPNTLFSQTVLTKGDIAFTRINIDDETFSFVFLVPIENGTQFVITDEAWLASDSLNSAESKIRFVASSAFAVGEEISISCASLGFSSSGSGTATLTSIGVYPATSNMLGAAGDNLFVFQPEGNPGENDFIAGISANRGELGTPGNAWQVVNYSTTSSSELPTGLTNGSTAVGLFPYGAAQYEVDNARYKSGALHSGDKETLLAAINNPLNWDFNNSTPFGVSVTDFSVTLSCSAPTAQATSAVFGSETSSTLTLTSFTPPTGDAVTGYAVYINNTNSFSASADGDEPSADVSWNDSGQQPVYFGTSANPNFTVSNLDSGTQYFFQIYSYNDCSGTEIYETTGLNATYTTAPPINITWTGTTDNDWGTASNWSTSSVPTASQNITIPSGLTNYPTATSAVSFNTMTINSGASFIPQSTATGAVTFNRNLPNANWYLISAPVSGESLDDVISNNTLASGTGGNLGLGYYLNNAGSPWHYATSSANINIANGLGISLKLANPGDLTVSGSLNTSNIIRSITVGTRNNFNLLGNPFTAYVNSATFTSDNEDFLTEKTIWIWEGTQYKTYNTVSSIELAPGQGFFVEASANRNVTFTTANRSHQSADTFKREAPVANFELSTESDNTKSATKVFYVAGKTTGFDNGYDSKLFSGLANSFNVYTELVSGKQDKKLAIQTLDKDDTSIIPVGVIASVGKEITFSLKSENLGEDVSIYLEDKLTGAFINVSETTYQATITEEAKGVGRFYIHTTSASLNTENLNTNNISIYKSSFNEITIDGLADEATFKMFSVTGKEVMHTRFASHGKKEITLPSLAKGVYVVQLTTEAGIINKKIILE